MKKLERYPLNTIYSEEILVCKSEDVDELEAKYAELEAKYAELEAKCVELRTCIARQGHVILTQRGEVTP